MSIASRIEQIEQHIENAYESIGNKGVDLRDKLNIDLKGNTSQEVVSGEVGLEVNDTSIYVGDVNTTKENYITLKGNTYQNSIQGNQLINFANPVSINSAVTYSFQDNILSASGTGTYISAIWNITSLYKANAGKTLKFGFKQLSNVTGSGTVVQINVSYNDGTATQYLSMLGRGGTLTNRQIPNDVSNVQDVLFGIYPNNQSPAEAGSVTIEEPLLYFDNNNTYEPYTNGASPNPDYPQEVEVVTGLNEVEICGKNVFNIAKLENASWNYPNSNTRVTMFLDKVTQGTKMSVTNRDTTNYRFSVGFTKLGYASRDNIMVNESGWTTNATYTITANGEGYPFLQISRIDNGNISASDVEGKFQFEYGDTATTYEDFQGVSYQVNLGKNLFDKDNINGRNGYLYNNRLSYRSSNADRVLIIPCQPNTIYTISRSVITSSFRAAYTNNNIPVETSEEQNVTCYGEINNDSASSITITTNDNAKYLIVHYGKTGTDTNLQESLNSLQIEKGSSATSYAPYFTPIELCKIGTYQDKIYKSNIDNNWYIHKEIGKVVLDGSETIQSFGESTYEFRVITNLSNIADGTSNVYCLCDKMIGKTGNALWNYRNTAGYNLISSGPLSSNFLIILNNITTSSGISSALSTLKPVVYYVLTTPTDTQITDATLVNQLNALYNATIYSTTHINTETSNLLPYIDLKYNVVTASPSPDRASEVEVVKGNNVIKVQSKNLFDGVLELGNFQNETGQKLDNNSYIINSNPIPVEELTNYKISSNGTGIRMYVFEYKADLSYNLTGRKTVNANEYLTTNAGTKYINFRTIDTNTNLQEKIQVEQGNTATSYVPYQSQFYNITLGNLELCKIGDYQDYFYKDNGNWYVHKEVGKVVFDGTEYWEGGNSATVSTNYTYVYTQAIDNLAKTGIYTCFNNKFDTLNGPMLIDTNVSTDTLSCGSSGYNRVRIMILTSRLSSANVNGFKSWLSNNNVTLYYVLTTPTTTEITDTKLINQLNALADARKYEDGIETIINQTNSGLSFEIEINPTHLNRNIENISTEIDKIETTEWKPQPDWWDIKTIIKDDEENYPYKIIALQDEGAKTLNIEIDSLFGAKKVKLSDGQEITTSGLYTVNEEGLKNCSKGYKTFYSIWYFNDIPNFSYNSIGHFFRNSRYIYFYNIENINLNSSFSWVSNQNRLLEAVESNKQIATVVSNESFRIIQANSLRKIPDWIFRRNGNVHSPNTIGFSIAPYIKYKDMTKIINSRNFDFTSGTAPEITNSFLDETIDFENDWGMQTTLFTTTSSIIGPYAIQKMNFENVTSFRGTLNVSEVYEVYNIKISNNYFTGEMLSHDTLVRVLNALYNYSDSEDTYTLTLGTTNLAKLTNDEKAIATNKGWTLA